MFMKYGTVDWELFNQAFEQFNDLVYEKKCCKINYASWKTLKNMISKGMSSAETDAHIQIYPETGYVYIYGMEGDLSSIQMIKNKSFCDFLEEYFDFYLIPSKTASCDDVLEETYDNFSKNMKKTVKTILENDKEKENGIMKGFNFDFGSCKYDNVRMSMYGLAIQNAAGSYVSYNTSADEIVDVDPFNFEGGEFLYKMPVAIKDIKPGMVVIHNRVPMFVTDVEDGDITVVDPRAGERKNILPTKNMFGFNFVTRIISMLDMTGGANASESNPFGNMLPFLMLKDGANSKDMMMAMMLANGAGANEMTNNPLMWMMMFNEDADMKDMLLPMMLMGGNSLFNTKTEVKEG